MRLSALVFFFASCYLLAAICFSQPAHAQTLNQASTNPQNSYAAPSTNPDVPKNLHTYTQSVMIEVMSALTCQLSGRDLSSPNSKCLGVDPRTGNIGFVEGGGGALGVMGGMLGMLYTPPAHTSDYVADLAQNFGITKHAYAASGGIGFQGISPMISLWSKFRDIVYLLFVLVFVVVGVAVMLRVKIDPRTVMTIQNQIPKIIVGLLLVTFSFAIAGFLIDLMYVFIFLILNLFEQQVPSLVTTPFGVAQDIFGIFNIAYGASHSIGSIISNLTPKIFTTYIGALMTLLLGPLAIVGIPCALLDSVPVIGGTLSGAFNFVTSLGGLLGGGGCDLTNSIGNIIVGSLTGIIAFVVIMIALLWALFRLWFTLLNAYVMILIDIVFAPFWIVAGLFPGSSISFTAWLRSLVANLAAFPATIVLFLLGARFMEIFSKNPGNMFVPPMVGNPNAADHFGAIIGLGIILSTPNIVKTMRNALNAPKLDLSSIGAAIGIGASVPSRTISKGVSTYAASQYDPYGKKVDRAQRFGSIVRSFIR